MSTSTSNHYDIHVVPTLSAAVIPFLDGAE